MANYTITINDDRVTPLSNQQKASTGFSHRFQIGRAHV